MDKPVIHVEHLSKQFKRHQALRDVTFSVAPGAIFGYLGPNGAGKTTTVRILLGLLSPTSGCAQLFGVDAQRDDPLIRQRIGVVLDQPGLYERLTAYDNLLFYARLYHIPRSQWQVRIEKALSQVKLAADSQRRVAAFSKGMKQRLAIARALLHEPELLFLDEPSSGLDPEGQREIRDLLLALVNTGEHTIFLCSHNLDEVQRICTQVAIIKQGQLLVCDTLENLKRRFSQPQVRIRFGNKPTDEQIAAALQPLDFAQAWQWNSSWLDIDVMDESCASALLPHLLKAQLSVSESVIAQRPLEDVYHSIIAEEAAI